MGGGGVPVLYQVSVLYLSLEISVNFHFYTTSVSN